MDGASSMHTGEARITYSSLLRQPVMKRPLGTFGMDVDTSSIKADYIEIRR
jgi:hypothetical protein